MTAIADAQASQDNLATLIAVGLLAYASADIAHHVVGHGLACIALGGHIISLSSIFVDCSIRSYPADIAGPFANLGVGLVAFAASRWARDPTASLFLGLAAGFNLLWFVLQFVFSIVTRTDDFTWLTFHVSAAVRYGLIALGIILYLACIRMTAAALAKFALSAFRLRRIVWTAWLTAGIFACLTALLDRHPAVAILHHAAPQSFALSIGLLFVPSQAIRYPSEPASAIDRANGWVAAAFAVAVASFIFLGPGFSI